MSVFTHPEFHDHEQVVHWRDRETGLQAILAIHDTTLGPALGGCRMCSYESEAAALDDVLRLSRAMTYKAALAKLPFGGGKSVILGDPRLDKTPELMRAMGRAVEGLGGRYIVAEDSGTSASDLRLMGVGTSHVVGVAEVMGWDGRLRDGDPSPATAYGVFVGMRAAIRVRYGRDSFEGVRVAIQGLGNVGRHLAELLAAAGAELIVTDLWPENVRMVVERYGARAVSSEQIVDTEAEIFAPCALGAVIDDDTVARLRAGVVAGSANNQLARDRHGDELARRGILYAPDYAINAGGLIDVASEYAGYDPALVRVRLDHIADTLARIFAIAAREGVSTHRVADHLAEQQIAHARGRGQPMAAVGPRAA